MMQSQSFLLKTRECVIVREGQQKDVPSIWAIFNLIVKEHKYIPTVYPQYSPQERINWFYETQQPKNWLVVAEHEQQLIAYLTLEKSIDDAASHVCSMGILIHPTYRNLGLGTHLVRLAIEQAKKLQYEKMILSVFHNNPLAIGVYHRLGFQIVGRRKKQFKIDDDYIDELIMEHYLS